MLCERCGAEKVSFKQFVHQTAAFSTIEVSRHSTFAIITLNRPKVLNALSSQVMKETVEAASSLESDPSVRSIIMTGSGDKAFAAGADIKEMSTLTYAQAFRQQLFQGWDRLTTLNTPLIAAVNGYALGGGCELALMCDIIIASETASFGLPEVTLSVIPGIGGTQRLARLLGRAKAMDMILTAERLSARDAERLGLVSRVVAQDQLMKEAISIADKIGSFSAPAVAKAKACVKAAEEMSLTEGLKYERSQFWSCFALDDQKEGMAAFLEKRKPAFKDQ